MGGRRPLRRWRSRTRFFIRCSTSIPATLPPGSRLARNFINKAFNGIVSSQEGFARARESAEKALAIDPDYAPAHATLGNIATVENDDAGAAKHYERALALDPTDLSVVNNAAFFLKSLGRLDEALALQEKPLFAAIR